LEAKKAALLTEMNQENADHRKIAAQLQDLDQEVDAKTERWLELAEWVD
jgi:ABC transport system ATP-binding/permease protein